MKRKRPRRPAPPVADLAGVLSALKLSGETIDFVAQLRSAPKHDRQQLEATLLYVRNFDPDPDVQGLASVISDCLAHPGPEPVAAGPLLGWLARRFETPAANPTIPTTKEHP